MQRGFGEKLGVSIATVPDDSLQADASYFTSITGRDILDKDFVRSVNEREQILPSPTNDGSIYLKHTEEGRTLLQSEENNSLDPLEEGSNDLSVNIDLNDSIRFAVSPGEQCNLNLTSAQHVMSQHEIGNKVQEFNPVRNTWVTTKADKAQLRNSGLTWKTGKWTNEETELLKRNIAQYCLDHNIDDPRDIIYNASKDDRPQFYPTISAGLNRPVFAVYRRVKRMYDAQNYRGKYTPEEVEKLKVLYKKYGHDWTQIGNEMGRSSDSVKDRCRLVMNGTYKPGKWSEDEEIKLAQAVYTNTGVEEGTSVTSAICWISVAKEVGTRNQKQCRAKWLNYLNWKMSNGEKWTKSADAVLLQKILESGAQSEDEIDWKSISTDWKSSRSPQWLRIKWWSLKQYYLHEFSDISNLSFNDLLQAMSKIISDQIRNAWDSKRCRKPLGQILKCEAKEPPKKIAKLTLDSAKSCEQERRKNMTDVTLIYTDSSTASNMTDKIVFVGDPKTDLSTQLVFDENANTIDEGGEVTDSQENENFPGSVEQNVEVPISVTNSLMPLSTTIELTPTSTPGVYLFENSFMVVLSDGVNDVEFVPSGDGIIDTDENNQSQSNDDITSNHSDIITTSDVLVYQETGNDDDIKNPILGSAMHEVATSSSHDNDDDSCFIQGSSPLQGTLLEGTDLATASLRMDVHP